MSNKPLIPESKLPSLGTTIFSQMSALAQQHQAINLSQGFPDFDGPRYLQERLAYHVAQGANQYAPMTGVAALREAIVDKTEELYGYRPDANSDVTVTAGATEALYAAITALVRSGDEVICFDPSYDSYAPAVELSGGVLKRIALQPPYFRVDWQQFAATLSDKLVWLFSIRRTTRQRRCGSVKILPRCGRRLPIAKSTYLAMKFMNISALLPKGMPACWRIRSCASARLRSLHSVKRFI